MHFCIRCLGQTGLPFRQRRSVFGRYLAGFGAAAAFEILKIGWLTAARHSENLLEKQVVRNLKYTSAFFPKDGEHHIAIDNPSLEVFGQKLDGLTHMKRPPDRNEKTRRDITDHGPDGEEAYANHSSGADEQSPQPAHAHPPKV